MIKASYCFKKHHLGSWKSISLSFPDSNSITYHRPG